VFQDGDQVRLRNDPSVGGTIVGASRNINGRAFFRVHPAVGVDQLLPESQLEHVPGHVDPIADLKARKWSAPADLGRVLSHVRLTGKLADLIYSMESTNTVFHAYQFKPVVKLLNSATKGLLIADEVGLGKTIEAGLIWKELVARYDRKRLLVVCPKSLQQKWRAELRQKFSVPAQVEDAEGLLTTLEEASASDDGFAIVSSLSALRPPKGWDDDDSALKTPRARLARLLNERGGQEPLVDLVIFDEAHHLRNPDTAQHKLAQLLVDVTDYRLLLSATPINLHSGDLRVLLKLLDPDLFQREVSFDQLQQENEPILATRQRVLDPRTSLEDVLASLEELNSGQLLKTTKRLDLLKRQLAERGQSDGPALRADIAARLEEMSMLGGIVNRTRRRDVNEIQVVRRASTYPWSMSPAERDFYDEATAVIEDYALTLGLNERFLLATAQRLIASSLAAAYAHWASKADDFGLDEDSDEDERPGPLVSRLAEICRDADALRALRQADSKLAILEQALSDVWRETAGDKVIVFSSFRRTIDYLQERLSEQGIRVFKLHGSIEADRNDVLDAFESTPGPSVLLTSEVGGEGLDLQFCRVLINYDLPWNPMRVEQRIGRVDRIGQAAPSVRILNLICSDTIEERIFGRLYTRLELIERTIGGFEAILGPIIADLERKLLDPKLTPEEQTTEIERAAVAIQTKKIQQDQLEDEAPALIAHGDMILNRIRNAHEQQKWIQPQDLAEYVADALRSRFPATSLDRAPTRAFAHDLRFCSDAHVAFTDFLNRKSRRYPTSLRNALQARRIVFGRNSDPQELKGAEIVAMGHPLVRFASELREEATHGVRAKPAVGGRISAAAAPQGLARGRYAIVAQQWSTFGLTPQEKLVTAAASVPSGDVLDLSVAEALASALVAEPFQPLALSDDEVAEAAAIAEDVLLGRILFEGSFDFVASEEAAHADKHETRLAVLRQQREAQRIRAEDRIRLLRSEGRTRTVPMEEGKLRLFLARMDQRIADAEQARTFRSSVPETLGVAVIEVA
jgi:SNF2 family DNA or RNA helicase